MFICPFLSLFLSNCNMCSTEQVFDSLASVSDPLANVIFNGYLAVLEDHACYDQRQRNLAMYVGVAHQLQVTLIISTSNRSAPLPYILYSMYMDLLYVVALWLYYQFRDDVIKWNIFHVTGPLWGESTDPRWIPLPTASNVELRSSPEQTVEQTI